MKRTRLTKYSFSISYYLFKPGGIPREIRLVWEGGRSKREACIKNGGCHICEEKRGFECLEGKLPYPGGLFMEKTGNERRKKRA